MEPTTTTTKKKKKKKKKDDSTVRKGTWKAEEDQVLIKHVEKYGPREWSSIRSKGLLQRTGKSCRLRWVNKLQPNLKTGCKFTEEEERVVIELQARYGNKWARIATHLSGRTDNDVKNFWSSRQKRLARILRTTSAACSSSSSIPQVMQTPTLIRPAMEEETPAATFQNVEIIKTVTFAAPVAVKLAECHKSPSSPPRSEPDEKLVPSALELEPVVMSSATNIFFPEVKAEPPEPEDFIAFSPESQEILAGLGEDPFLFFDVFGSAGDVNGVINPYHQIGEAAAPQEVLELDPSGEVLPAAGGGVNDVNSSGGGGFNGVGGEDEDFPANYVFDKIDDLPSPSKW